MLILKPKLQYLSVFLQYFASKISTCTEESVRLEALKGHVLHIARVAGGGRGGGTCLSNVTKCHMHMHAYNALEFRSKILQ